MSLKHVIGMATLLVAGMAQAQTPPTQPAPSPIGPPAGERGICMVVGTPPASATYTVVKPMKFGKQAFGPVDEAVTIMANQARRIGADAIIEYTGSQRFGFWPWRFVRPVVRGTAVKWNAQVDCAAIGGVLR